MYSYNVESYFRNLEEESIPRFSLGDAVSIAVEKTKNETEFRYRALIERSEDIIFFADGNGKFLDISSKAHQLLGYYAEELLTLRIVDIVEERDKNKVLLEDSVSSHSNTVLKINLIHKFGNTIPVEISFKYISYNRLQGNIKQSLYSDLLKRAQKMDTIGRIAGGITHDFNNILTIILSCAQLVELNVEKNSESEKHLQRIIGAAGRGGSIAKQLLSLSKPTNCVFAPISVSGIVKELTQIIPYTMGKGIEMENLDLAQNVRIMGDSCQIYQAILNLLLNARDAIDRNGKIKITQELVSKESFSNRFSPILAQKYLRVEICDSGEGMNEITKEKIFNPFFTTKKNEKGTGLGLAVVKTIVEEHSGFIDFQSTLGQGTTFSLFFPVLEESDFHQPNQDLS
ncbi:PAS domain S-box protein [Leptospira sp. 201903070]|jgi:PAS domain S-box-containing protein|uniref:histidine kinase n=1 Tax=Leptospira ainlahdjerensis TaxID=2810033 RepID=A0ABS2UCD0_9LEPT|nr:ATP-binding protein [Leptospira ainlahdjerensis]MBM9577603.1 PAS domain S-box protein [Leptospira ainlahdjerensis]